MKSILTTWLSWQAYVDFFKNTIYGAYFTSFNRQTQYFSYVIALLIVSSLPAWAQTNNALHFDGTDDQVVVAHDNSLNISGGDFTLEAWVYPTSGTAETIASKGNGDNVANQDIFIFQINSSKIFLRLGNTSGSSQGFSSNTDVPLNTWSHIAAVFNNTSKTVTFYLNGVADGGGIFTTLPLYNADTNPLYIGRQGNTCNCNFFNGRIDEVRIWSDQRTQKELSLNMNNAVVAGAANLVAYYQMNEGTANGKNSVLSTTFDLTASNFDGTLTNFTKTGTASNFVAGFTGVNHALNFDGVDDFVNMASPFTNFTNAITVEMWVNINTLTSNEGVAGQSIANVDVPGTNVWLLGNDGTNDGTLTFFVNDNGTLRSAKSTTDFRGTGWHHIAGVADASGITIYVDGVAEATGTGIGTSIQANGSAVIHLGKDSRYASGRFLDGNIDELRIWSSAHTCAQIKATKDVELTGSEAGLEAYYNFNYGLALANAGLTTLLDLDATNSNNGILTNFSLTAGATSNWVSATNNVNGNVAALQPEINVQGNAVDITSGNTAISVADHTFFPSTMVSSTSTRTYTIQNTGNGTLTLSSVTSSDATNFTISKITSVLPGGEATFTISYRPTTDGAHTSTITINNNDCDEGAYTFQIRGYGAGNSNALDFDGTNDYLTSTLDGTGLTNLTLEMWVNEGTSSGRNGIFQWANVTDASAPFVYMEYNTGNFRLYVDGDYRISTAVVTNVWYHFAATYDGTTWRLYKNGQLAGSYTGGTTHQANATSLYYGAAGDGVAEWNGLIDEARVWSVARSQEQIIANMNQELTGSETGLLTYYNFNQGTAGGDNRTQTTLYDVSPNTANATLTNFETVAASTSLFEGTNSNYLAGFTSINHALNFDGTDDQVVVPHDAALNLNGGDFTLEAWVYPTSGTAETIVSKGAGGSNPNENIFFFQIQGSKLVLQLGNTSVTSQKFFSTTDVTLNAWNHVAAVFNNTTKTVTFYLNGTADGKGTFTTLPLYNADTNPLYIGRQGSTCNCDFFNGNIDEVRIWNKTRTCAEINSTKNVALVGSETGLVAYYNFNHGVAGGTNTSLASLPDISTNSNTGTLTNFALAGATSNWVDGSGNTVSGNTPVNQPEANVQGNSNNIVDGSTTINTTINTDFQTVYVGNSKTIAYTIQNLGTGTLNITNITLGGPIPGDYSLGALPTSVAAGGSATFEVTFTPTAVGSREAIVMINNNDCDEAVYNFTIQGMGTQGAPGGVTSGLKLWLKADTGVTGTNNVTQWNDQSNSGVSNATEATNGPQLVSNGLNFNPVLSFDAANSELLTVTGGIFAANTITDLNTFLISRTKSINVSQAFFETVTPLKFAAHIPLNDNSVHWDAGDQTGVYHLSTAWGGNTTNSYLWTFNYSTTSTPDGNRQDIRRDGLNIAHDATASSFTGSNNNLVIASNGSGASSNDFWDANVGEFIVYTSSLTATQQQQVESYLALKYGITIDQTSGTSYLASDGTTTMWSHMATNASTYNNDIAGIGRDDASLLNQKQSKSINTGAAITMGLGSIATDNASNSNTFSADRRFMTWGNNAGSLDYVASKVSDGPNSGVDGRLARVWQVQDGGVGKVQVQVDISGLNMSGVTDAGDIVLLVDDNGTDFSNATLVFADAFASNVATFTVDFNGIQYISVGQWNGAGSFSVDKGNCLDLTTGTDDYVISGNLVTTASDNFTVEFWFKSNGAGSGTLFYNGRLNTNGYGLALDGSNYVVANIGNAGNNVVTNTTTQILANTWYHAALVRESGTLKLYINGKEEVLGSNPTPLAPTLTPAPANSTTIGANLGGVNGFPGVIDEMKFWNVARTQSQIRESMHLTLEGSEAGVVAYYQFNETSGNAIDAIGRKDGVLELGATRSVSDCPVGRGRSQTITVNASGNQDFSTTSLQIEFAAGVLPNGDIVVSQLDGTAAPTNIPSDINTYPSAYWIVHNYGANSSFTELSQVIFTVPNGNTISPADETNPANIRLFKRSSNAGSGEAWTEIGGASAASVSGKTITFTTFTPDFTSFSQIIPGTVNSGTSGLPVTLGNFEAIRQDEKTVRVRWETISENNNAGFEVQKSENGIDFEIIGFVDGVGNSTVKRHYQFLDYQASQSAYYRLKQIDQDGQFIYSNVRFVRGGDLQKLSIYPNPFTSELTLDFGTTRPTKLPVYLEIYSAKGQLLLRVRDHKNNVQQALNNKVNKLKAGTYIMRVLVGDKAYTKRMIKH